MVPVDPEKGIWEAEIQSEGDVSELNYRYFVEDENLSIKIYECDDRTLVLNNQFHSMEIHDQWRPQSDPGNALFTSAFTRSLLKPDTFWKNKMLSYNTLKRNEWQIRFQIYAARVDHGHRVGITGNCKTLGNWDPNKGVLLSNEHFPLWMSEIRFKKSDFPLEYKYFIYDTKKKKLQFFEEGYNRSIEKLGSKDRKTLPVIGDEQFLFPSGHWKGAGLAIPVFSLRREDGYGVGEFTDLKLLVDWAKKTGLKVIQILPVNDTVATHTWTDSYPYAAISVFALHPIYANIEEMGSLKSATANRIVKERGKSLNQNRKVDYEGVMQLKSRYFKNLYDEQKEEFFKDSDFQEFFEKNEYWLKPYAAFSYLRDLFNTPNFNKWGKYKECAKEIVDDITSPESEHYDDIAVHYFIQYHLHRQLTDAAEYARKNKVILKGDIPIGIYRNSVDAWVQPELYNLNKQAGAPPDDFSEKGQNWGFPTYNWTEMAKDGYQWWKDRLQKMSEYFDAFRIDHILGFFRIWEIPYDSIEGIMGYFNPSIAFDEEELGNRGIRMDYDRLCKPYIREHFLHERFGDLTQYAKDTFLQEYYPGCYHLKPEFDTQRKIADHLADEPSDSNADRMFKERLKHGLFSLVAEIIFLENPYGDKKSYFPRSTLHYTNSFRELDDDQKNRIHDLYLDYFYKRNEDFWRQQALIKLPAIKKSTDMLICGEDLGMVPHVVPDVMNDLGILSLEIQRMPKNPKIEFNHPAAYPYLSVATPSSHDMSTIRGWWESDPAMAQRFYNYILGNRGNSPFFCDPWLVEQILDQHFYAPSMLTIFPLQDLLAIDAELRYTDTREERINIPANPQHYWRYRMHLSVEELMQEKDFNRRIFSKVKDSGRLDAY